MVAVMTEKFNLREHLARIGKSKLNRPVPAPSSIEARRALAYDLSRHSWGPDVAHAHAIAYLPLMEVALAGSAGMDIALRLAQQRKVA